MRMLRSILILAIFFVFLTFSTRVSADPIPLPVTWSQLPDMEQGVDWLSMHRQYGPIVADDFQAVGSPIVGFHWWGSYFIEDPLLDPGASRQVEFEISFHPDCPAGDCIDPSTGAPYTYSTPGQPYQFQLPISAQESFYGITDSGERVYEYWAMLNDPWEVVAGNFYWVDFGWNAGQFDTDPEADIWGWHGGTAFDHNYNQCTACHTLTPVQRLNFAVQTDLQNPNTDPHTGPWTQLAERDEMAFEVLTSVPEPSSFLLLGAGLAGVGLMRRRFKN